MGTKLARAGAPDQADYWTLTDETVLSRPLLVAEYTRTTSGGAEKKDGDGSVSRCTMCEPMLTLWVLTWPWPRVFVSKTTRKLGAQRAGGLPVSMSTTT
jgi:hypothetical protein